MGEEFARVKQGSIKRRPFYFKIYYWLLISGLNFSRRVFWLAVLISSGIDCAVLMSFLFSLLSFSTTNLRVMSDKAATRIAFPKQKTTLEKGINTNTTISRRTEVRRVVGQTQTPFWLLCLTVCGGAGPMIDPYQDSLQACRNNSGCSVHHSYLLCSQLSYRCTAASTFHVTSPCQSTQELVTSRIRKEATP